MYYAIGFDNMLGTYQVATQLVTSRVALFYKKLFS
jgi:hypothetical protein